MGSHLWFCSRRMVVGWPLQYDFIFQTPGSCPTGYRYSIFWYQLMVPNSWLCDCQQTGYHYQHALTICWPTSAGISRHQPISRVYSQSGSTINDHVAPEFTWINLSTIINHHNHIKTWIGSSTSVSNCGTTLAWRRWGLNSAMWTKWIAKTAWELSSGKWNFAIAKHGWVGFINNFRTGERGTQVVWPPWIIEIKWWSIVGICDLFSVFASWIYQC